LGEGKVSFLGASKVTTSQYARALFGSMQREKYGIVHVLSMSSKAALLVPRVF
jgi:hypothetical protein